MTAIVWVDESVALAIHDEQLAEHGGAPRVRDPGLLSSALVHPRNLIAYGDADLAAPAAAYGYGLLRNHPFIDGNKRTALVLVELFLALNGHVLEASDEACVVTILAVAEREMDEAALAAWIRRHSTGVTASPSHRSARTPAPPTPAPRHRPGMRGRRPRR